MTRPIIEYYPDGSITKYEFNNKGQILQWADDGIHTKFEHDFNGYMPYFK